MGYLEDLVTIKPFSRPKCQTLTVYLESIKAQSSVHGHIADVIFVGFLEKVTSPWIAFFPDSLAIERTDNYLGTKKNYLVH